MSDFSEFHTRFALIEQRLAEGESRQARTELTVKESLASREWVRELVGPIADAVREMKHAVDVLGRDNQSLNAAHNKLLEERAQREKEEHAARMKALESQTWSAIIKDKWAPIGGFIVMAAGILTLVGQLLSAYLAANGVPIR